MYAIQNGFSSGEMAPSLWGRTDLAKYKLAGSTCRNGFINYRGGFSSRAGTAYVGMTKQGAPNAGGTATSNPPRDIRFQFNISQGYVLEFGDQYMRIKFDGAYITETGKNISGITQANPGVFTSTAHGFSNDDWVFLSGIGGATELNGLTYVVQNVTTNTFTLTDLFGNAINTFIFPVFTSGGTAARIYTVVAPYAAVDIPFLKFTQSADTMTLTCVNQNTGTEYPSYELVRNGVTNWVFTADTFASAIAAPTGVASSAQSSATVNTWYSYVVTAVDATTGEESIMSKSTAIENNDISINAGSNTITWSNVAGASTYNVYASIPSYNQPVQAGVNYGFIGTSFGGSFTDTNIVADFTTTPPTHQNPFARGQIIGVTPTAGGSAYTQAGVTYAITTVAGSGAVILPIVVSGAVVAYIVQNSGTLYAAGDTIAITADGTGATATLVFGPAIGTYPSVCSYYQQRRVYGNTKNNPDTYYMSQPGAYSNMDSAVPTTDSDAIIGTPWAQQINGIQFFQPMQGGLIVLSGNGAWQVNGGVSNAITPADQSAQAQAYNGCNAIVPPIVVNYDILYVQSKGSIVRDLSYNFFVNIYTGTDITILSNHLFDNHSILQWAYAEEPYKLIWAIRDDGVMLSLTYLKEQDIYAWARHDTNGLFVGVTTVTSPHSADAVADADGILQGLLTDAVYVIVKRYIQGYWVYYSERMDDRNWFVPEECWCVDAGLSYAMPEPNAILTPAAANGTSNISSVLVAAGGSGYTAPVITAVDETGAGTGATFTSTVVAGAITAIIPVLQGTGYAPEATQIVITDPTGVGAVASPVITNIISFTASASVFTPSSVGSVIRIAASGTGGGKATVTSYVSGTQVMANVTQPITNVVPNDPNNIPIPQAAGNWSITASTSVVTGLNHLAGMQVAILGDGSVFPNQTVSSTGTITLSHPCSQILVGLSYQVQVQTLYLEARGPQPDSIQGKRKSVPFVILRVEASRGYSAGTNQIDASVAPNNATVPWINMVEVKERNASVVAGSDIPLFTGDSYMEVFGEWDEKAQIAIEQNYPLPLNLLAVIVGYQVGDTSS